MKLDPYIAILIAATLGGASGVLIKLIGLPSTSISFFRLFVPAILLLAYFGWKKINVFHGNYKIMLITSVLNAFRMFLYFIAYLYTTIGNAVIILFTWPIFATLLSAIFLKEKVTKKGWLLILMSFAGVIVMYLNKNISFSSADFIGMGAMLLSGIIYAIITTILKNEFKNYAITETIFYQNMVGALVFLPFIFLNTPAPTLTQITVGRVYGAIIGIGAFLLFFYALKRLKMSEYTLFTYWEVPAAIIFGVIFLKETITLNMVIGGALIITSGLLLRREKNKLPL